MIKVKKGFVISTAIAMTFALSACGSNGNVLNSNKSALQQNVKVEQVDASLITADEQKYLDDLSSYMNNMQTSLDALKQLLDSLSLKDTELWQKQFSDITEVYRLYIEILKAQPYPERLKDVHDAFLEATTEQYNAILLLKEGLDNSDSSKVSEGVEHLNKAKVEIERYGLYVTEFKTGKHN
jgi:hypothetical protein